MVFNTARAKMMKALFTLESEPMRPQLLDWRSRTVDLILDTLEPFRITQATTRAKAEDIPSRRGLKQELWKIVKQAFSLATTMRCQRASYFTDFRPPMEDYVYDAKKMRHVFGAPEGINSVLDACRVTEGVSYHVCSVGKVVLTVSPALVKVGEGTDWTVKRQLAKMNVIANIRMGISLPFSCRMLLGRRFLTMDYVDPPEVMEKMLADEKVAELVTAKRQVTGAEQTPNIREAGKQGGGGKGWTNGDPRERWGGCGGQEKADGMGAWRGSWW